MAVIAINIDPTLYTAIEQSVASGKYSDVEQFFTVAARNQLALEKSAGHAPTALSAALPSAEDAISQDGSAPATGVTDAVHALLRAVPASSTEPLREPETLDDESLVLWGQVNRVLPIAVGVRVLANLAASRETGVPVEEWHNSATAAAVALRPYLRELDDASGRRHGSLWSTALPDETPASANRYASQFLGFPRDGTPEGGAAFLGFVTFDSDGTVAQLTTAGAEWAAFPNPIFDGEETPARTFSIDEAAFFLDHLRAHRPAEFQFLQRVSALVEQGGSRTQLDEALAREYPQWEKYIGTMRAGALGRISDLGLLERTRRGLTVDYALTPLAAELGLTDVPEGETA